MHRPSTPPAVSVLLPFHDCERWVGRCLESLLEQTFTAFEIVAVDDGSRDGSAAIVRAMGADDSRIRLVTRSHGGIVAALNAGLAECRGGFIARMDADDWCHPERLERQYAYMQAHPACALAGSLAEPHCEDGDLSPGVTRYHRWMNSLLDDASLKANLFVESPIPHPSFFVRRELYDAMEGYRDRPWPEDYDFLMRAASAGYGFGKVPEVLLHRTDGPGRLTRTDARYKRLAMFRAKAHFFARGPWLNGKSGVVIGGSGPSGRNMAALLLEEGVEVHCFLDNRMAPPNRKVMTLPAYGFPGEIPGEFFRAHRNAFFLSCIGEEQGRARLLHYLLMNGFAEERDYLLIM
jgi:glycosyltransferase involved in cell wall biosynthesis